MWARRRSTGSNTRRYRLEYAALLGDLRFEAQDEIEKDEADVWIVDEPDLPKFVVRADGLEGIIDGEAGKFIVMQEIYDVNADVIIEPPADAEDRRSAEEISRCTRTRRTSMR